MRWDRMSEAEMENDGVGGDGDEVKGECAV